MAQTFARNQRSWLHVNSSIHTAVILPFTSKSQGTLNYYTKLQSHFQNWSKHITKTLIKFIYAK